VENFGKSLVLVNVINMDCLQSCIVAFQHTVSRNNEGHFVICIKVALPRLWLLRNAFFNHILCAAKVANFLYSSCFYDSIHNSCLGVLTSSVLKMKFYF